MGRLDRAGRTVDEGFVRRRLGIVPDRDDPFRTGPTMIDTLSCSTSFLAARSAESGLALVEVNSRSTSLPNSLPPACLYATWARRTPSSPSVVSAPSSVAMTPIRIFSCVDDHSYSVERDHFLPEYRPPLTPNPRFDIAHLAARWIIFDLPVHTSCIRRPPTI